MSTRTAAWTVGRVAAMAGVSVRTLHHYDAVGLLSPTGRSHAGYREYSDGDLARLHQILLYRELGFPLDEITTLVGERGASAAGHLRRQHELLESRIYRLQTMVSAIERMLEAERMDTKLTPEEQFEVFGDFNPDEHEAEAQEKWGDTDAYKESARRTASYSKADWLAIKEEAAAVNSQFNEAMTSGVAASDAAAMDVAEAHRQHISRWFYTCTTDIHRGLAEMYIADPRFEANYEKLAPGLAHYVHDAVLANAARVDAG